MKYLIRDRDGKSPALFDRADADAVLCGIRVPRVNSIMERWIQACRHELLDRTLILNQAHLLHALREYGRHHNENRRHRGIVNARPLAALSPNADVLHTWVLESTTELKKLRAAISGVLHGPDAATDGPLGDVPERMVLVATELAANAIRHGLAPTEVRLLRAGDMFVLDVADHDPDTIPEPAQATVKDMGGRGLPIAQSFSLDVGWYSTPSTKHVWATFTDDL